MNTKQIKIGEKKDTNKIYWNSGNGVGSTKVIITIKVRIFDIEIETDVYIVGKEDFKDFILGIDTII